MNTEDSGRKDVFPRWVNISNFTGVLMLCCACFAASLAYFYVRSVSIQVILVLAIYLLAGASCFIEGFDKKSSEQSRQSLVIVCLLLLAVPLVIIGLIVCVAILVDPSILLK